jgi:hypothetical protein
MELMVMIAFPIKWFLAISLRTIVYISKLMGIPCTFRIRNGTMRKITGINKLTAGDNTFI